MTPWTAVWIVGLALALAAYRWRSQPRWGMLIARALAGLTLLLAVMIGSQCFVSTDIGLDLWLFPGAVTELQSSFPGRPSMRTAVTVALVAVLLLLMPIRARWMKVVWPVLAVGSLALPFAGLVAYAFAAAEVYSEAASTGMAITTAASLAAVAVAAIGARPDLPALSWILDTPNPLLIGRTVSVILGAPFLVWVLRDLMLAVGLTAEAALALAMSATAVVVAGRVVHLSLSMERELTRLATTDSLTGLVNRAHGLTLLDRTITNRRPRTDSVAVLFCDIDHFKVVNDTYGHAGGDEVLRVVAQRLVDSLRFTDVVARIGGDEFMVILTHVSSVDEAAAVAEKLRLEAERPIDLDGAEATTSLTIGVALATRQDSEDELIDRADRAMYRGKRAGRNKIVVVN